MDLRELVMTTFVLIQAQWPVEKSCQLIEQLQPSHVIVHRRDLQDVYYLFSTQEVLRLLTHPSHLPSIHEALLLDTSSATPVIESDIDALDAPDQCIVFEDGYLVGFLDASVSPQPVFLRRGEDKILELVESNPAFRSLVTEFPEQVRLHDSFSLLVSLSASSTPEAGAAIPFALPSGSIVDVLVQPRQGLILEGNGQGTQVVSSEEATLPLQFKLRAVAPGPCQLRVLAFHQGQPLGQLLLRVTVLESPVNPSLQQRSREQPLASVTLHQPDLQLLILGHPGDEGPEFTFHLTAHDSALELNLKPFGPIRLKVDALQYFQEYFREIENLLKIGGEKATAEEHLAAKGAHLFQTVFPADLQVLLWSLRDRIQSIEVQSVEPWIPWELCKLCGSENGQVVEGPFLCEAFTITRWIPGTAKKPRLNLKNIGVVVPADSRLVWAASERDYLLSLADGNRQVRSVPARFLDLRKALASGQYDGWHFSGHGGFRGTDPNQSTIFLEHRETFTPEDLSGVVGNLGVAKPLVFFNACQVGRSAMSLTDIGGWAKGFLHAGVSVFIGPYWSIYDEPAFNFARVLYDRLLDGMSIGNAVREARIAVKSQFPGNPTWLAYTVFADPLATIVKGTFSTKGSNEDMQGNLQIKLREASK